MSNAVAPVKMDPELKRRWIEALRSGEYTQGESALRTMDTYCCLGVLCNVVNPDLWVPSDEDEAEFDWYWGGDAYQLDAQVLPVDLRVRLGIPEDIERGLVEANDNGTMFDVIADMIEERL